MKSRREFAFCRGRLALPSRGGAVAALRCRRACGRRCRCSAPPSACGLRSRSTCRRARCTSCTCTWSGQRHDPLCSWRVCACAHSVARTSTRGTRGTRRANAAQLRRCWPLYAPHAPTLHMQRGASSRAASSPPAGRTCRVVRPAAVSVRRLPPQGARDGSNPAASHAHVLTAP